MKYYLDTEFVESVGNIDLLSIALVREDGRYFYAEVKYEEEIELNSFVRDHVIPSLKYRGEDRFIVSECGNTLVHDTKTKIGQEIIRFIGSDEPEFWGYYADYDWVVFCWLFGSMIDLPDGFPMYCNDLIQELKSKKIDMMELVLSIETVDTHNALDGARWNKKLHEELMNGKPAS